MLAVLVVSVLGQTPGVMVASTLRQGVSIGSATELVGLVSAPLERFPVAPGPAELTACKRKLPCLVAAAKKAKAGWLVAVEAARVVDQVIVKVVLLSIEEDGRAVATAVTEGTEAHVRGSLAAEVAARLGPPLERAFPQKSPPPTIAEVPPAPLAPPAAQPLPPPPPPPPVAIAQAPASSSALRTVGLVTGLTGLVGLAAAGVLGGITLDTVAKRDARCPPGTLCNDPTAVSLHNQAVLTQELGGVIALVAGAAAGTGVVLFFLGAPSPSPTLTFFPTPSGAGATFSSSF